MKKKLSTVLLALVAFMPMTAQNLVKGNYGYLYCHMAIRGSGQPTLFPVMPTSPVCIMVKDTSWLPPICACARVTNGTTMVSIS